MAKLLFLVHRLPYPPNKGDKVRSYHLLKYLAARHTVYLGTFVDDPDDEQYLEAVRGLCAELHVTHLNPKLARLGSVRSLWRDEPLTLGYYRSASLTAWVNELHARRGIDGVVVFSSSMAQFASGLGLPVLVDFVDVDSAKWADYAAAHRWPMSWLYRREGETLLRYEREVAGRAEHSFFATEKETELFRSLAPECGSRIGPLGNGVNFDYFAPDAGRVNPFAEDELPLVFTGAMDYWPNVDAVSWFARDMLPALLQRWPQVCFHIVGRSPTAVVNALAGDHVKVSGTVPDVRPYLQHAAVVVAPLRLARGIQNKVLEAMAMARPVVAASTCVEAIDATPGVHLLAATQPADYVASVNQFLAQPTQAAAVGQAGRHRVMAAYSWACRLTRLDSYIDAHMGQRQAA